MILTVVDDEDHKNHLMTITMGGIKVKKNRKFRTVFFSEKNSFLRGWYQSSVLISPRSISLCMLFSSARQVTEHMNGILKGRVSSLKGIRTQIKEKKLKRVDIISLYNTA